MSCPNANQFFLPEKFSIKIKNMRVRCKKFIFVNTIFVEDFIKNRYRKNIYHNLMNYIESEEEKCRRMNIKLGLELSQLFQN